MQIDHRAELSKIKRFDQLIAYLRDEMGWPIAQDSFEDVDDLFYDFTPDELGIDVRNAAKIQEIKRLRPLSPKQPWGIFFVKFEPKRLPVVALRRILGQVALKKRASANSAEMAAWAADDLLFVSNYGEGEERQISFAHFSKAQDGHDLPTLKVLGWDNLDTALHLDAVVRELTEHLAWPDDDTDVEAWRERWRAAFTLRHREVITTSKDLSTRLAELARAIRDRIKTALAIETPTGPLTKLMKAFQEALVHDLDADGFADMYAQTIAYGLLSARIADPKKKTADDFAGHMRTNPFLRDLMETFLKVGGRRGKVGGPGIDFDELGVTEVVELLDDANMEAVARDFGDKNPQEDPVIHFYELFLKEYDAKKRMQRGVFYTPRPVVSYIVRSVDGLLRTEFGLDDGLADTTTWGEMAKRNKNFKIPDGVSPDQAFVQILDPACGTGTFLVESIDFIHKTLVAKWKTQGHDEKKVDSLWNDYVPKYLLPRFHGYELLMAPYAIAHLKIGLKLYETGYKFKSDQRAKIYLTNTLEPASPLADVRAAGIFEALGHEAQAVNEVKRKQRFTVVIGNPPYANYGKLNKIPFILRLLKDYKQGLAERKINLDDDFIKFIRFGQWLIGNSGCGILAVITNSTYLDGIAHRRMRHSLLETFPTLWISDLHGSTKRHETSLDGISDANVFDIQQGVAIGIFVKLAEAVSESNTYFVDMWGTREEKYHRLAQCTNRDQVFVRLTPQPDAYYLIPHEGEGSEEYQSYWSLASIFPVYSSGIDTKIDRLLIDRDPAALSKRMADILNPLHSIDEIRAKYEIPPTSTWEIDRAKKAVFSKERVTAITYRIFDSHYTYFDEAVLSRARQDVMKHILQGENIGLICARQLSQRGREWALVGVSRKIIERCAISSNTREGNYLFPLYLYSSAIPSRFGQQAQLHLTAGSDEPKKGRRANLGSEYVAELERALCCSFTTSSVSASRESTSPEDIFGYIYAILHSPQYRTRYGQFLKSDFPRLPLTSSLDLFRTLADRGRKLTALHLMQSALPTAPVTRWHGPTQSGEVEKITYSDETVWINRDRTEGFINVPKNVWNFQIGGYQVCEKWLKDRKGRILTAEDITHYQKIVVALSETIRLMKEIDGVIEEHGGWPGAFAQAQQTIGPDEVVNGDTIKTKAIQTEGNSNKREEAQVEIILKKERETPGTWRYKEENAERPMTIYLTKVQVSELGDPESIKVTIEAA